MALDDERLGILARDGENIRKAQQLACGSESGQEQAGDGNEPFHGGSIVFAVEAGKLFLYGLELPRKPFRYFFNLLMIPEVTMVASSTLKRRAAAK